MHHLFEVHPFPSSMHGDMRTDASATRASESGLGRSTSSKGDLAMEETRDDHGAVVASEHKHEDTTGVHPGGGPGDRPPERGDLTAIRELEGIRSW
jgi:hypothetical protein